MVGRLATRGPRRSDVRYAALSHFALGCTLFDRSRFRLHEKRASAISISLVSRPRSSVRDVRARALVAPFPRPAVGASETQAVTEREGNMAVSQPRPPDRVDAAREKVAPLRYLKAHECNSGVTRYHKPLS